MERRKEKVVPINLGRMEKWKNNLNSRAESGGQTSMKSMYAAVLDEFERRKRTLEKLTISIQPAIEKLPKGKLWVQIENGHTRYYKGVKEKGKYKKIYVPAKEDKVIRSLIQRSYLEETKRKVNLEIKSLEHITKLLRRIIDSGAEDIFDDIRPERKAWITPVLFGEKEKRQRWENEEYEPLQSSYEKQDFFTEKGEQVRSKSEMIIASRLYQLGIQYKYEKPLFLPGFGTVYPDFTLYDAASEQEIYIEHMGLMDDQDYRTGALRKIEAYQKNGFLLGKTLIVFFESHEVVLNVRVVDAVLHGLKLSNR
ncbi:MAG: hypothetical protein HUJ69_02445 [Lachnospiraceae bacterium]|nr:hypothetical protein [Lachnospiraceae bacterium]